MKFSRDSSFSFHFFSRRYLPAVLRVARNDELPSSSLRLPGCCCTLRHPLLPHVLRLGLSLCIHSLLRCAFAHFHFRSRQVLLWTHIQLLLRPAQRKDAHPPSFRSAPVRPQVYICVYLVYVLCHTCLCNLGPYDEPHEAFLLKMSKWFYPLQQEKQYPLDWCASTVFPRLRQPLGGIQRPPGYLETPTLLAEHLACPDTVCRAFDVDFSLFR